MTVDNLAKAVTSELDKYQALLNDGIEEVYDEISSVALKEIVSASKTAGFKNKKYADGWTKTTKHTVKGAYRVHSVTIWNKKHFRLTHLLEKSHQMPQGGRSTAFPHIGPTQNKMDEEIIKRLKEKISETQ